MSSAALRSPVTAASRSNASAASEFSEGVALSKKSWGRTISASASDPVVKNPPLCVVVEQVAASRQPG